MNHHSGSNYGEVPLDILRQIEEICLSFEKAWLGGQAPHLDDYLAQLPRFRPALFADLLAIEIDARSKQGESPAAAEYVARFPEFESIIKYGFTEKTASHVTPKPASTTESANMMDIPSHIGKYQVIERLGKGGQAEVFRVVHPTLKTELVLKRLVAGGNVDPKQRQRLQTEGQLLSSIEHPNLARVFDLDCDDEGRPFIVLEYIRGQNLRQQVLQDSLSARDAVRVVAAIASAVSAIHRQGIIHRDIKPENILMDLKRKPRLIDFGLARLRDAWNADEWDEHEFVGTIPFMPPEQARGEPAVARSDVFGLGAVAFWLLTGETPYSGSTPDEILTKAQTGETSTNAMQSSGIDKQLAAIVMKALEKDPENRHGSADKLAAELELYSRRSRRRIIVVAAVASLLIAILGVAGWWHYGTRAPEIRQTPLQVTAIDVLHFANTPEGDSPQGLIGQQSFTPLLGDRVQVEAKLSKPAYAYLIAFRPDGVAELCFPEDANSPPSKTDTPRYPTADPLSAYGLREGTGLWVFAVVASEEPLPAYRDWLKQRFEPDTAWIPLTEPLPGIVWWDDGVTPVQVATATGRISRDRGKGESLEGPVAEVKSTIRNLTEALGADGKSGISAAKGFCVMSGR